MPAFLRKAGLMGGIEIFQGILISERKGLMKKGSAKNSKGRPARKRRDVGIRPVVTCQETWFLLQDVFVLLDEAHRLFRCAIRHDEALRKSGGYGPIAKKLGLNE